MLKRVLTASMAQFNLPLITHAGVERAEQVSDRHKPGNPLLLDFALKRHLRFGNKRLQAGIFHTRSRFAG